MIECRIVFRWCVEDTDCFVRKRENQRERKMAETCPRNAKPRGLTQPHEGYHVSRSFVGAFFGGKVALSDRRRLSVSNGRIQVLSLGESRGPLDVSSWAYSLMPRRRGQSVSLPSSGV